MALLYFTTEYAIRTHDKILEISGGMNGLKDLGNLESPLEHIKNDNYYPDLEDKITHLVFSINKNHAFVDGNKRTSIALGAFFLELNGLDSMVSRFIREMENIAVHVADNRISKQLLFEIITSVIYEDDYSEELKLKIISSISEN
ncbi:MAG TPA: type II toxin-antitoxin system death-on-curing family toxin [Chitinophagaceae bacterium]|jgi:death-on-curing protein|nr:type II toxin-antitoxin system death-on-curing family toxin [Chitinophagaceae bacterium]